MVFSTKNSCYTSFMDIISFKYFIEIANELNFTKAANNLYSSQQCLSQHVKRLEDYYGVKLLERKPKVKLTEAGRLLVEAGKSILEIEENLQSSYSYLSNTQKGSIRLGLPSGRAKSILNMALPILKEKYPNVNLSVFEGHSTKIIEEKVADGTLDIGVGSMHKERSKGSLSLDIIPLCREKLFLLASDSLLKKHINDLEIVKYGAYMRELMSLPVVMDPRRSRIQSIVNEIYVRYGVKPNVVMESNRGSSIIPLCTSGYCAIFMLEMILNTSLKENPGLKNNINIIHLLDDELVNTVCLITPKNVSVPRYTEDFKSILTENIPKLMLSH